MQQCATIDEYRRCTLEIHLLPRIPWQQLLMLQRRLVFELGDDFGRRAALVLAEHPPTLVVGRQGSHAHIRIDEAELSALGIEVIWTNRGGGCWLHGPGSLAINAIVPVFPEASGLAGYRRRLDAALRLTVAELLAPAGRRPDEMRNPARPGAIAVGGRPIAGLGVAVKNQMAYHGGWINASLDPDWSTWVEVEPDNPRPMTSLFRELRTPVRIEAVREAVIRNFVASFGFGSQFLANVPATGRDAERPARVRV